MLKISSDYKSSTLHSSHTHVLSQPLSYALNVTNEWSGMSISVKTFTTYFGKTLYKIVHGKLYPIFLKVFIDVVFILSLWKNKEINLFTILIELYSKWNFI